MKRVFMAALGAIAVAMTAALAPQAGALLPYAPLSPDRRQHSRFDGRGSLAGKDSEQVHVLE